MNGSLQQRFGDNIYHRENGKWLQADSRHSQLGSKPNPKNLKRDTGRTDRVLISSNFTYWGGDGTPIPQKLKTFVHTTPGCRAFFTEHQIKEFLGWAGGFEGRVAKPLEWRYEKWWR